MRTLRRSSLIPQAVRAWRSLWVALLVDAADSEHARVSRIASYKNLGDGDKQTEDDETDIDLKEYMCLEKIWRQWDDNADSPMSEGRRVETSSVSCFHCTNRRRCCRSLTYVIPRSGQIFAQGLGFCFTLIAFFGSLHSTRRERESISTFRLWRDGATTPGSLTQGQSTTLLGSVRAHIRFVGEVCQRFEMSDAGFGTILIVAPCQLVRCAHLSLSLCLRGPPAVS